MSLYLADTGYMYHLINKTFPTAVSRRFMVRMDSQVFNDKEDESIFLRKKYRKEHMHVYFDLLEVADIAPDVQAKYFEIILLKSFRQAIADGKISIEKELEWSDNATARKRKREKEVLKAKKRKEAISEAKYWIDKVEQKKVTLPDIGAQTVYKLTN